MNIIFENDEKVNLKTDKTEDLNEMMNYLSQVVLSVENKEIARKKSLLEETNVNLKQVINSLSILRERTDRVDNSLARETQVSRLLSTIVSLKKEGAVYGQRKQKVNEILEQIPKMNFEQLKKAEQKCTIMFN